MEGLQSPEARIAALEDAIAEEIRIRQKLTESLALFLAGERTRLESDNTLLRQHIERLAADAKAADAKSHLH